MSPIAIDNAYLVLGESLGVSNKRMVWDILGSIIGVGMDYLVWIMHRPARCAKEKDTSPLSKDGTHPRGVFQPHI